MLPLSSYELARILPPMILQFFVLSVLWMGTVAPEGEARWTRVLLPFLMIATGLLFFSAPLAPLWQPVLGGGGHRFSGFPPGGALLTVLALNLGCTGWVVLGTGGLPRSPFVPLLFSIPFAAALLMGAEGGVLWGFGGVAGSGVAMGVWVGLRPGWLRGGVLAGTLAVLLIASWLQPSAGDWHW
jgi:hypothetical protein